LILDINRYWILIDTCLPQTGWILISDIGRYWILIDIGSYSNGKANPDIYFCR